MHVILLSGTQGTGKTSACLRLAQLARDRYLDNAGILAPALFTSEGAKSGIAMLDVATLERRCLTDLSGGAPSVAIGQFRFNAQVLDWAVGRVTAALSAGALGAGALNAPQSGVPDLIFVDEIGPLELRQGAGFSPALKLLATSAARACVLVVRASLCDELADTLSALNPTVVSLDPSNRDDVPRRLLALVLEQRPAL